MPRFFLFFLGITISLLFCGGTASLQADEGFKVENELTVDKNGTKVKSTTLFSDGIVYDFIDDKGQGEITILDPGGDRFILLDPVYRLQTRLPANEMRRNIEQRRAQLIGHEKPLLAFVAQPTFEVSIDETTGRMRFQSSWADYEIATQTVTNKEMAAVYDDYCLWCCYLNFHINPEIPLSLLRLDVNREVKRQNRLPGRVTATFYPRGKGPLAKSEKFETTHRYIQRLSEFDLKQINVALDMTGRFRNVPFKEYQAEVAKKHLPAKQSSSSARAADFKAAP